MKRCFIGATLSIGFLFIYQLEHYLFRATYLSAKSMGNTKSDIMAAADNAFCLFTLLIRPWIFQAKKSRWNKGKLVF